MPDGRPYRWSNADESSILVSLFQPFRYRLHAELVIGREFWKPGLNEVRLRYAATVRADEVYGGSDPRELGLRVESIELLVDEIVTPD